MDSQFPSGFRRWRTGTTVLTLLNVVDDTVTSILWGSLPFCTCKHEICVKICECIIKYKMLIWTWLFLCCWHLPFQCSLPFFKKKMYLTPLKPILPFSWSQAHQNLGYKLQIFKTFSSKHDWLKLHRKYSCQRLLGNSCSLITCKEVWRCTVRFKHQQLHLLWHLTLPWFEDTKENYCCL